MRGDGGKRSSDPAVLAVHLHARPAARAAGRAAYFELYASGLDAQGKTGCNGQSIQRRNRSLHGRGSAADHCYTADGAWRGYRGKLRKRVI